MKSRQIATLIAACLALTDTPIPETPTTIPPRVQLPIPRSVLMNDLCLDCRTGPFTIIGPTTVRPVKLQIDPHTGRIFRVP